MSSLYFWPYTLRSVAPLNAKSGRREHEGSLLRIGSGYGCLHPWPELGDLPLDAQLTALVRGGSTPLLEAARRCAEADGRARAEGRSLFEGPIPKSHWLALPGDDPAAARAAGFERVKLKIGRDPGGEIALARTWAAAGFFLRLDANESLAEEDFISFWNALGPLREQVELVEDSIPWAESSWQRLRAAGVPLAVDRDVEERFRVGDVAVVKPARSAWTPSAPARFLVTSYMDHALGQMWAAAEASRLLASPVGARLITCGLMTNRCFEKDPFFEQIRSEGPRLQSPGGTGLGFDDLLESLPWKILI